jgi:hypothetical protein
MNDMEPIVERLPPSQRLPSWLRILALALVLVIAGAYDCRAQPATPVAPSQAHVYLLRGAFNIFSLGLDDIADKLAPAGIATTVTNYLDWQSVAEQAAAGYNSGRLRTIILVGHSSGAVAVTEMAAWLSRQGVPVKLAIGLDPTSHMTVTGNVELYINYYVANGMGDPVAAGAQFTGKLQNIVVENNRGIDHFNIDKDRALQERVVADILSAVSSSADPTTRKAQKPRTHRH